MGPIRLQDESEIVPRFDFMIFGKNLGDAFNSGRLFWMLFGDQKLGKNR